MKVIFEVPKGRVQHIYLPSKFPSTFQDLGICIAFLFLNYFACTGSSLLCGLFFSSGDRGLLFVVLRGLIIAVASLLVEYGL